MRVDPIKPTLKAPETKRLELIRVDPLSNVGFKFNSRRYFVVELLQEHATVTVEDSFLVGALYNKNGFETSRK